MAALAAELDSSPASPMPASSNISLSCCTSISDIRLFLSSHGTNSFGYHAPTNASYAAGSDANSSRKCSTSIVSRSPPSPPSDRVPTILDSTARSMFPASTSPRSTNHAIRGAVTAPKFADNILGSAASSSTLRPVCSVNQSTFICITSLFVSKIAGSSLIRLTIDPRDSPFPVQNATPDCSAFSFDGLKMDGCFETIPARSASSRPRSDR